MGSTSTPGTTADMSFDELFQLMMLQQLQGETSSPFQALMPGSGDIFRFNNETGELEFVGTSPSAAADRAADLQLRRAALGESAADRAQRASDAAADRAQQAEQFGRSLEEQIRQFNKDYAINLETLALRRDEYDLAVLNGDRATASSLAGMVANAQSEANANAIAISQMKNQAAQFAAQMESARQGRNADRRFSAAQESANRAVQLASINEQMRSRNIDQQIEVSKMIADFSRDPGDIVANIAAQQQFGSVSTALAKGWDGLTDEGLAPLARMIDNQETLTKEGDRLAKRGDVLDAFLTTTLNPNFGVVDEAPVAMPALDIPNLQQPDIAGLFNKFLDEARSASGGAATATEPTITPGPNGFTLNDQGTATKDDDVWKGPTIDWAKEKAEAGVPKMATGGVTDSPVVEVGDPKKGSNKPNREFLFNLTGAPFVVVPEDKMPDVDVPRMAEGGVVDSSLERARALLSAAFGPALASFRRAAPDVPFSGGVPAPINVSAPGTNPDLQEAAMGLAAARGVKRSTFLNELLQATPTGISAGVVRRTA